MWRTLPSALAGHWPCFFQISLLSRYQSSDLTTKRLEMQLLQLDLNPFNSSVLCVSGVPGTHVQVLGKAWRRTREGPSWSWQCVRRAKTPPPGWCPQVLGQTCPRCTAGSHLSAEMFVTSYTQLPMCLAESEPFLHLPQPWHRPNPKKMWRMNTSIHRSFPLLYFSAVLLRK